ncbi:MAG: hypothetical protein JEY96_16075 [Bacteroidales bacterium]|nr:hypothetical protein [Bacteroidales bacterium]
MKNTITTGVIAILMFFCNTLYSQTIVEKSSAIKSNEDLELNFEFADEINVSTWDKNEVYVKVSVSINENEDNDHFALNLNKRSTGVEFESEIKNMKSLQSRKRVVSKNGNTTTYNSIDMELIFDVKIPKDVKLEIETISGNIEIIDFLGRLEVKSISGFIDVTLPTKHNADLELSTISGGMYSNFEFNNEKHKGYYHYGKHDLSKRLNNGGIRIFLETISGDIYLRKSK